MLQLSSPLPLARMRRVHLRQGLGAQLLPQVREGRGVRVRGRHQRHAHALHRQRQGASEAESDRSVLVYHPGSQFNRVPKILLKNPSKSYGLSFFI